MTERLEQEWKSYCEKQGNGTMNSVNVKDVAQHFYNLALEDVKKEIEKVVDEMYYEKISASATNALKALQHIVNFINQQSK